MKKTILLLSAFMLSVMVSAQGIEFKSDRYADILKLAKKEKKAIFIDVYTSWCGPCKHMSENIFTLDAVGKVFNEKFINIKLDAEKSADGKEVAKKFGVSAYPTLLFVNGDGELVYRFLGGRDQVGILMEADKAIAAYNAMPALKKLDKRYEKGDRSKEFLNEYFIAKDNSGLDCGALLVEYFNLLTDEEILDPINYKRIEKMTAYDAKLANRIVELAIKANANSLLEKKAFSEFNKGVGKFLGNVLSAAAKNDREQEFEDILNLKDGRYYTIKGNSNSVMNATLGGGNLFVPSELLRLDYYIGKNRTEKFIPLMESYIASLQKDGVDKKAQMLALKEGIAKQMEEAKKNGDTDGLKSLKQAGGLMSVFGAVDDYYISTNLINYIEKYVEQYKGEKNSAFEGKIVEWYKFLCDMSVSCKTAPYAAEKLIAMGKTADAKEVLTAAMADGQKAMGVEAEDIEKCKKMLEEL